MVGRLWAAWHRRSSPPMHTNGHHTIPTPLCNLTDTFACWWVVMSTLDRAWSGREWHPQSASVYHTLDVVLLFEPTWVGRLAYVRDSGVAYDSAVSDGRRAKRTSSNTHSVQKNADASLGLGGLKCFSSVHQLSSTYMLSLRRRSQNRYAGAAPSMAPRDIPH